MLPIFHRLSFSIRRKMGAFTERLAQFGGALVWPIERLFAATFGRLMRAFEGFERLDQWLLGLLYLLTWPIRVAWRLVIGLLGFVLPAKAFDSVVHVGPALIRVQRRVVAGLWELIERLNLDGPMRRLAWLTQPLWRPIAAVGGFFFAWLATRRYKQMLWGLPVLIVLMPIAGAVAWGVTWGRESVATQYRLGREEARTAQDQGRLALCERKLEQLGERSDIGDFKAALALASDGELDEAYLRMQELAPAGSAKFAAAHHWILVRLLSNELPMENAERLRLAGVHLEHLKTLGFKGPELDLLRAIWLAQNEKLAEAADLLKPLVTRMRLAAMQRFEIDVKLNRADDAREDARALRSHFAEVKRRDETLTSDEYLAWSQAELLLGNTADWSRVVREWLSLHPDIPAARQSVAKLDLQELNEILQSPQAAPAELTERLIEVARLADNPTALDPLVANLYSSQRRVPALAEMFEQLKATPDLPIGLTAALGTAAALGGDVEVARARCSNALSPPIRNMRWHGTTLPGRCRRSRTRTLIKPLKPSIDRLS